MDYNKPLKDYGLVGPPRRKGPKTLVFDIETAPYLIWAWGIWKTNAIDIYREWWMLCAAYGWFDHKEQKVHKAHWMGINQDPGFKPFTDDDRYIVGRLGRLLHEADIVVGQNHERFDIRKANEKLLVHGWGPPSPYQTVDVRKEYKRYFAGPAGLKYMTRRVDVAQKGENRGWPLWRDCIYGDKQAWRDMRSYNLEDVIATAQMYVKVLPWIGQSGKRKHPNLGHWFPGGWTCPNCGNLDRGRGGLGFQIRGSGWERTNARAYKTVQCNKCGKYPRMYQSEPQRTPEDRVYLR